MSISQGWCATGMVAEDIGFAVVAHRGASIEAPENTLAAIELAWRQNADAAEFDIHLTKDGRIVLLHDKDTERTAGVKLVVRDSTLEQLQALDVGRWKGEQFSGERIPTLEAVLATAPQGKKVFIEVKCGVEIVEELDRVLKSSGLASEQIVVISFHSPVVAAVKKKRPDVTALLLVDMDKKDRTPPTWQELTAAAKKLNADGVDLSASDRLDADFVRNVKAAGLQFHVWTVDDEAVARRMAEIGVDGITTNRPKWLREIAPGFRRPRP